MHGITWLCRALREEVYRAEATQASSGDIDNTPIIEKVRLGSIRRVVAPNKLARTAAMLQGHLMRGMPAHLASLHCWQQLAPQLQHTRCGASLTGMRAFKVHIAQPCIGGVRCCWSADAAAAPGKGQTAGFQGLRRAVHGEQGEGGL